MPHVVWEELDFTHGKPLRTATLSTDGSTFRLLRERGSHPRRFWASLTSGFLPEGYPDSVTSDYLGFQFWDTLQGLSTYIRSMLSTNALLSGIGVGKTSATVIGATFQWFLRDFTGMLGGVVFTIYQGSNLDCKAKQWRLAADFMNDIGMLMDLISPLFPRLFISILCLGSLARSVTGVASGATRAALTQHFALQQNAADISAKEGSQETAATLVGMLMGMLLAEVSSGHTGAIWLCFLTLTGFHMFANYKAVRCLCLTSLNQDRIKIVLQAYLATGRVLTPSDVSSREVLLPQFSTIKHFCSHQGVVMGAKISTIDYEGWQRFPQMVRRYAKGSYMIYPHRGIIFVILHRYATREDHLKSYVHALVAASLLQSFDADESENSSCVWMESNYPVFLSELHASGWNVNRIHMVPERWRAEWHMDLKSD
ncbi:hypothetical protein GOP47_0022604 [Adiantum capillus-veneris]|uniref:Protein root UVB sensitive 3 n=1 Tax=Adiantum capillus-veneris TaxID=13818 RepID=A0A9D4Z5N7_ADICA|nr:hypothetical protein GOP47_0022604 [Adiantum capillus-veneris]